MNNIAEAYNKTYDELSIEGSRRLFNLIPGKFMSSDNGRMHSIFLKLTDESFNVVKRSPEGLKNEIFVKSLFKQNGNNIHLVKAFGSGFREFRQILNRIKYILKPKTITWYRDDFKILHTVKGV